tara:strand:+ start:726 stop:848 length:123 start_codon:yes stop_codon:yes gene_type:complete
MLRAADALAWFGPALFLHDETIPCPGQAGAKKAAASSGLS